MRPEELESVRACPVCGNEARSLSYSGLRDWVFFCAPGTWSLYRCHGCGSAYLDPRFTPQAIGRAYTSYFTHTDVPSFGQAIQGASRRFQLALGYLNVRYGYNFRPALWPGFLLAWLFPLRRWRQDSMVRYLRRPTGTPRLLDVGCGNGEFLAWMREAGWTVQGLDPDPDAVAAAREAGLQVEIGTLADVDLPGDYFDAVTMSHVIEHLHDPIGALRECYRVLRPGGVLWIATPNLKARGHKEFGKYWLHLDPPRHLVLFNLKSLRGALKRAGFQAISRPHAVYTTEFTFRACAAIVQGKDPLNSPPPLAPPLRRRARSAQLRSVLRPDLGEELVLLARK